MKIIGWFDPVTKEKRLTKAYNDEIFAKLIHSAAQAFPDNALLKRLSNA